MPKRIVTDGSGSGYSEGMSQPLLLTSRTNPRFKSLKAQISIGGLRRTHTLLLGSKLIQTWFEQRSHAGAGRFQPRLWLSMEGSPSQPLSRELGVDTWILGEHLMRDLADAGSPPDQALLMELTPEKSGTLGKRVIVPWGIQDPGNLGAILRSAAAFGFEEALLGPGCADPFSPKALRGTMGAAFLMQLRRSEKLHVDAGHWYALDGGPRSLPIAEADLGSPLRILVGNEGHGWQDVALPDGIQFLSIPIQGMESLNAAVAAGIACFEAFRREGR